ncbi:MAG: AAA family ATPase [Ruthenibacterium sp.]
MEKTVIAVAGKGGVGKTSFSAAVVRQLVREHPNARILAIDADPAVGLETALGVHADYTVDDIRKEITASGEEDTEKKRAIELLGESRFRLLDAMVEKDGFAFIAVGRPEAAGCYCSINTYLKRVISALTDEFDYVVIDGEAGVEQINRRVMEKVTHLVLITDPSQKGIHVIKTIKRVADELVLYRKVGAVVNRMNDDSLTQYLDFGEIPLLASIPDDKSLPQFDAQSRSILELPDDSALVLGVHTALDALGIK